MLSQSSTITYDLLIDQQFLIVANPKDLSVHYMNYPVQAYCDVDSGILENNFFKEVIHPEDLSIYMNSLTGDHKDYGKECTIRLKNKEQKWEKFTFKNRNYSCGNRNLVLSLAVKNNEKTHSQSHSSLNILRNEYEHLLRSLDDAFILVEMIFARNGKALDYLFLKTNPAYERQVPLKNVAGKTVRELSSAPSEKMLKIFGKVATTGKPVRFEDKSKSLGNSWFDMYVFKVGHKNGRQVAVLFRNITEGKRIQEQIKEELNQKQLNLQETTELLQGVFDTTNLAISVLRTERDEEGKIADFRFVRVNKVLRELYLEKDVIGRTYLESSKHGVELGIFDGYVRVMETGEPFDEEIYFGKEGFNHWFRVTARQNNDLLISTIEDITKVKAEAEELKASLKFKRELVQTTPEVIMIVNLNTFSVRYINKDLVPEAGITKERVQNLQLPEILPYIHPRDREKILDLHRKLLKSTNDSIYDIEIRLKLKGVTWEWFNVRGKVFQRRDENWVDEYVLLVRNISDQKSTQKALLKAEKLSIQGELARTFAHELRNPLASIGMVGEVLNQKMPASKKEEFQPYFDILKRSTKTLNNLVSNLLNAANYTPAILEKEDLSKIVEKSIHDAQDRIYLAGIEVMKNYSGPYVIMADKEKLKIALLNIMVNASEATIPGEGVIKIDITSQGPEFILKIQDNGHGMEQQDIEHLFEAFYSKKETGMGIGLSSVKNILEEHDAQIKVTSEPHKGTIFEIYFHNAAHL